MTDSGLVAKISTGSLSATLRFSKHRIPLTEQRPTPARDMQQSPKRPRREEHVSRRQSPRSPTFNGPAFSPSAFESGKKSEKFKQKSSKSKTRFQYGLIDWMERVFLVYCFVKNTKFWIQKRGKTRSKSSIPLDFSKSNTFFSSHAT